MFFLSALAVMGLFYGIYFAKAFAQKRRGIQTRQLGKGKEKQTRTVELLLSIATFAIVPVQLASIFLGWNILPGSIRTAGAVMGFLGDLIFLIAVAAMKDSWRAGIPAEGETALVSDGIYKYSRNPAFLGFDLMYIGILLMYFNLTLLICTVLVIILLHLQILQEERFLTGAFGQAYVSYKDSTARYLGKKNEHGRLS